MARYTGPKNRLSRREGADLVGKEAKLRRSAQPPGQHGPKGTRRSSDYAAQLRAKQKAKRLYGIMEAQFRKYFKIAAGVPGKTGEVLLNLLETRLDNVVFRLGLAPTRAMARQLVSHGHVRVNGQVVTLPSYLVKIGEVITLSATALQMPVVLARLSQLDSLLPAWLDRKAAVGKITALPTRTDIDTLIDEQLIVEFYSR